MSREELIPLTKDKDRPAVLIVNGWIHYISIHDAEYMRVLKSWKRKLADAHPDRGGSAWKFRKLMGQRLAWQIGEAEWYAQLELLPPDGFAHAKVKLDRIKRLKGLTA